MTIAARCRYCGHPCKKRTVTHYFGPGYRGRVESYERSHPETLPGSRAELQRLVNGVIVQSRWSPDGPGRYIERAAVWDGESYMDALFCTDGCAAAMGRSVCRDHGYVTQSYRDAVAKAEGRA